MPHVLTAKVRRAAAATVSAVVALTAQLLCATAASAAAPAPSCGPDEVTVVVDFNQLGGATQTSCVAGPSTAQRLFEAAGVTIETAHAPGMEGFVCRLDGRPAKGSCTRSDSYWSLWWADDDGGTWVYASLGARDLEIEPGAYVGFAWHQGSGDAAAPDLAISADGALTPERDERTTTAPKTGDDGAERDGPPAWLLAGGAIVVLGAAGAVPLLRRRAQGGAG